MPENEYDRLIRELEREREQEALYKISGRPISPELERERLVRQVMSAVGGAGPYFSKGFGYGLNPETKPQPKPPEQAADYARRALEVRPPSPETQAANALHDITDYGTSHAYSAAFRRGNTEPPSGQVAAPSAPLSRESAPLLAQRDKLLDAVWARDAIQRSHKVHPDAPKMSAQDRVNYYNQLTAKQASGHAISDAERTWLEQVNGAMRR